MSNTHIYGVVLPLEIAQKARVVAAMEGKSRSRLMRELLELYLTELELLAVDKTTLTTHEKDDGQHERVI